MATSDWIVVSRTPQPTITANIRTDAWNFSAETSADTSLSVLQNSLLLLMCTATYPVIWWGQEGDVLPQNRTYNPYLENATKFAIDERWIEPVEGYEAILTYQNITMGGTVTCTSAEPGSSGQFFQTTTIQLKVHTVPPDGPNQLRILQTAFEKVRLAPTPLFRYWESRTEIPILYAAPTSAHVEVSVNTPEMGTLRPSHTSNDHNSTSSDVEDLSVEMKSIVPGISQATMIVHRASYYQKGEYEFNITAWFQNGTEVVQTSRFFLHLDAVEFKVYEPERLSLSNFSITMTTGIYYLARMYLQEMPILNMTRLVIEERIQEDNECRQELRTAKEGAERCGIFGFSLFNEERAKAQMGVQIFLRAASPCVLTVITQRDGSSPKYSVIGSSAEESVKSPLIGSSRKDGVRSPLIGSSPKDSVKSSLITTTLDYGTFGDTLVGTVLKADPPLERDGVAYRNETLRLNCLLPKCHLFFVTWDKDGEFYFPPLEDRLDMVYAITGNISSGTQAVYEDSPTGRICTLTIPSLQPIDTGEYTCGIFSASSSNQNMIKEARLNVVVKDPVKPYFLDQRQFSVEKVTLPKDDTLTLLCNVSGDPVPMIHWYEKDGLNNSEFRSSDRTGTTFQVDRPGTYLCKASNKYGENTRTFQVVSPKETPYLPIAIGVLAAVILLGVMVVAVRWWRERAIRASLRELSKILKNPPEPVPIDDTTPLNDQVQFIPYNRKLEISRDSFTVTSKLLGEGAFGYIFKGELKTTDHSKSRFVAVKLPRDPYNPQHFGALVDEMKVMCHIRPHVNVLPLVGACTDDVHKKQLFVLTEFCENGSLKDYLVQNRMKFEGFETNAEGQFIGAPGAVEALLKYAYQAANGMTHLAAERIIHRDLALRNLLLTVNHIVKISDFGMSRQHSILYRPRSSKGTLMPVFWMAPEALMEQQYTQKSDVWSLGVVLWEMFSCGKRPYPDRVPDSTFCTWLRKDDNRLGSPDIECMEMYDLMRQCWHTDPSTRPTFSECKRIIARTLEHRSPSMYQSTLLSLSDAWLTISPENSSETNEDESSFEGNPKRSPGHGVWKTNSLYYKGRPPSPRVGKRDDDSALYCTSITNSAQNSTSGDHSGNSMSTNTVIPYCWIGDDKYPDSIQSYL